MLRSPYGLEAEDLILFLPFADDFLLELVDLVDVIQLRNDIHVLLGDCPI